MCSDQLKLSPQAQDPPALGLSIVKPCFSMVSTKSIDGTLQVRRAHAVDGDGEPVEVDVEVAVEAAVVEEELVLQTRAPARLDGDAQRHVVAALLVEQGLGLARGGVGQLDTVAASVTADGAVGFSTVMVLP